MRLPMHPKMILAAVAIVAVSFVASLKVMDWLAPRGTVRAPVLVELPPLPPAPRSSVVMAPVAIALSAIRDAAERGAQKSFTGKAENPVSQILQNADIGWTASRGPITATGGQDVLSLSTPITVVTLIWQFTNIWNDFLYGIVFSGAGSKPITVGLNNLANTSSVVKEYNVDMAAAMIAGLPTLFVYIVAGKYFVRGLTAGAVKG